MSKYYHYFIVDLINNGELYRVGVESEKPIKEIFKYLKKYSQMVYYEKTRENVLDRYLKMKRTTPIGNIFCSKYLFDRFIKVPKDHWSTRTINDLLDRQNFKPYFEKE